MNGDNVFYESFYPLINDYAYQDNLNSYGFNCNEFNYIADVIFLGCSNTFPQGVEKDNSWGNIFSKKMNLKNHNLSAPGLSTSSTINNFFSYVSKFGNPKIVCAIFPEFQRIRFSSRPNHIYSQHYMERFPSLKNSNDILRYPLFNFFEGDGKYFKLPLIAEEVVPKEIGIDISIQYIKMLELYCNSNKIKLLWGTWPVSQNKWIVENLDRTKFKNFINVEPDMWHIRKQDENKEIFCGKVHELEKCNTDLKCHKEEEELYGINFYTPFDFNDMYTLNHWGVHRHIHTSDIFLKNI
jgi:hypothetical protein